MSAPTSEEGRARLLGRPGARLALLVLVLVVLVPAVGHLLDAVDVEPLDGLSPRAAYLAVALLVLLDAVCPVLPGETTVTSAAILAAEGVVDIGWVCVAASVGAVVGDSAVYWIARSTRGRVRDRLESAAADPRARRVLQVFDDRAALMIVVGRYVPGLRLAVAFTMGGVVRMPYPRFLRLSALGGVLWGFYTALLAYVVATMLDGSPLVSLLVSGAVTSAAVAWVMVVLARGVRASTAG